MASTNPFQHVDESALQGGSESIAERVAMERKQRREERLGSRRGRRLKSRKEALRAGMVHGWPTWEGLRPVILFLMMPGLLGVAVALTGPWDAIPLYTLAGLMGLYVLVSAFRSVELVLACFLLYLPFSTTFVIPIAPGVNGTNMLILLGLFATVMRALDEGRGWLAWPAGTTTVFAFAAISAVSGLTILREPGGYAYFLYGEVLNYKAWIDQFFLYFIALSCIRSVDIAKRVILYMCMGSIVLVLYSVPEMLDKMGNSSIDKSRIGGPHRQPNMFGGFVAYTMLPLVALFVVYMRDIRAWLLTPYFLIGAKVLISTFSRGAYLAIAVGGFMAGYYKGKGFLLFWLTISVCALLLFPSLFPQAIKARIFGSEEKVISSAAPELDDSSEHRLILWRAAGKMIVESPILGKGFKGFKKLKSQYTERDIQESDPHSTYLYIATQMGLPALALFLLILGYSFHMGRVLSRNRDDLFIRAIGIGGASMTVCYAIISLFGSRAVNLEYTSYFWAYFVCMQVIYAQLRAAQAKPKKRRTNAFEKRPERVESVSAEVAEAPRLIPAPAGQRRKVKERTTGRANSTQARNRLKKKR